MNHSIDNLLLEGHRLLHRDLVHELPLRYRRKVFGTLDRDSAGLIDPTNGHRKRIELASKSILYVIDVWNHAYPNDNTPLQALALATRVMSQGEVAAPEALEQYGNWLTQLDDISYRAKDAGQSAMVGFGAIQVVAFAIDDRLFGMTFEDEYAEDGQGSPDEMEPSYCAVIAFAGRRDFGGYSPTRAKAFWEWWLGEAARIANA